MKRQILYAMALALSMASCSEIDNPVGTKENNRSVNVVLTTEGMTMTSVSRSAGEPLRYIAEIWSYDEATSQYDQKVLRVEKLSDGSPSESLVFELPTLGRYRMLLWADHVDASSTPDANGYIPDKYYVTGASTSDGLKNLTVCSEMHALNNDYLDAFYKSVDFVKEETSLTLEPQVLTRAVGKLVVVEKDAEAFTRSKSFSVTYNVPAYFNVETGATVGDATVSVIATDNALAGNTSASERTIFFDYILCPAGSAGYSIPSVTLSGKDASGTVTAREGIPSLPIKQNKRTMVSGSYMLVTPPSAGNDVTVSVSVTDTWGSNLTIDTESPIEDPEPAITGEGTLENPYQIGSIENLLEMMQLVNEGSKGYAEACYCLTADIMASNEQKICIGTPDSPFAGTFDGQGYKLSATDASGNEKGLTMMAATAECPAIAMFGVVDNATFKNVYLVVNNQNKETVNSVAGGLVGISRGNTSVESSWIAISNLTAAAEAVGGICGRVESGTLTIKGCKVSQTASNGIKGSDSQNLYIGGILGHVVNGAIANISDSYNIAKVVQSLDEADSMGGFVGGNSGTLTVTNCYSAATFGYPSTVSDSAAATAESGYIIGGGDVVSGTTITDCWYVEAAGKKAKAKYNNGATKMGEQNWPAWNTDATLWKNVGAYSAEGSTYPTLDWE